MPRRIAAGNWKMNGLGGALDQLSAIAQAAPEGIEVVIAPPATLLDRARDRGLATAGQDCHVVESGAHTGDLSAAMLADAGADFVIVGHSERRADHGEDDATVRDKAEAAWAAGLTAIVCVGETLDEREAGRHLDVVRAQVAGSVPNGATADNTVIAYEPVWAIGTGRVAEPPQVEEVHAAIRSALAERFEGGQDIALLYGGSVKAANAADLFALGSVDGALVGGASLRAEDFLPICQALADAGT